MNHRDSNTNNLRTDALTQARQDLDSLEREDPSAPVWFCERCSAAIRDRSFELDGRYAIVCRECYLANPPAEDIAGALWEIEDRLSNDRLAVRMVQRMEEGTL
jgi:hypothetical protein